MKPSELFDLTRNLRKPKPSFGSGGWHGKGAMSAPEEFGPEEFAYIVVIGELTAERVHNCLNRIREMASAKLGHPAWLDEITMMQGCFRQVGAPDQATTFVKARVQ